MAVGHQLLGLRSPFERAVVLLPAGHPLSDRSFLTLTEVEALPGYEADLPNEALDAMVDRVALGQLVVVVGDSVHDRLGGSVRIVPVQGYPITQLVLAWLPAARPAAARLTATARAVLAAARPPAPGVGEHRLARSTGREAQQAERHVPTYELRPTG